MAGFSARGCDKDVSAAERTVVQAPVIMTDRGRPSLALLSIADYQRLLAAERSIVAWLSVDDGVDPEAGRLALDLEASELLEPNGRSKAGLHIEVYRGVRGPHQHRHR